MQSFAPHPEEHATLDTAGKLPFNGTICTPERAGPVRREEPAMKILEEALGRPFTDPDPDHARMFFAGKTRRKIPKLIDLKSAVARHVHDGDYLVIGGFGAVRAPMAAVHEIVRQGRKHLGFAGHTSTHDIQVLTVGE
ncbi:MAG: CoA-transferase, partial [Alkalispirochaeta sp.]